MSDKKSGNKINKNNKNVDGDYKKQNTIELIDGTIVKPSRAYKKTQKCFRCKTLILIK